MPRKHRLRCRRGGGGRGGGGRGVGSHPPLSIHDSRNHHPPMSNDAQFHFTSAMDKPRITAIISVFFQEEQQEDGASGCRKRQRNSTIPVKQPQDTRKTTALPVNSGSTSSSSDGASSGSSAHVKKTLKDSCSSSFSESSFSKGDDDDLEDYIFPIVEENPPPHTNS